MKKLEFKVFNRCFVVIFVQHLPENAYKRVSGRLFVSMTRVCDGSNYIESEFNSNKELIDVRIVAS